VLYANDLAEALFSDIFPDPVRPANLAHYVFLSPPAWTFRDWEKAASDTVAVLRCETGRKPYDRGMSDLVGQLSTRSEEFRVRWDAHDVGFHRAATKQMHHPLVGDLTLACRPGLSVLTYSAEPGSLSEEASSDLARWSETRTKLSAARAVCRRQQLWRAPRRILEHPRSRSARSGCWHLGTPRIRSVSRSFRPRRSASETCAMALPIAPEAIHSSVADCHLIRGLNRFRRNARGAWATSTAASASRDGDGTNRR